MPAEAGGGEPSQRDLDVDEEGQQKESRHGRRCDGTVLHTAVEDVQLQHAGVVIRNNAVTNENGSQASRRRIEQCRPVTVDPPIGNQVEPDVDAAGLQGRLELRTITV